MSPLKEWWFITSYILFSNLIENYYSLQTDLLVKLTLRLCSDRVQRKHSPSFQLRSAFNGIQHHRARQHNAEASCGENIGSGSTFSASCRWITSIFVLVITSRMSWPDMSSWWRNVDQSCLWGLQTTVWVCMYRKTLQNIIEYIELC